MKIKNECIPCVTKQLITLAEKLTQDVAVQKDIISYGLKLISDQAFDAMAPELTGKIYAYARKVTGIMDPYLDEKTKFNDVAIKLIQEFNLKELIEKSDNKLETAIRLSIAGNIIDFSLGEAIEEIHVKKSIDACLTAELFGNSVEKLIREIHKNEEIMIIGDNAGEIVFDQLLIECLENKKITYVVKGGPIVNDATILDAKAIGLDKQATIVDTGSAYQGIIFDEASEAFKESLRHAKLVISKGQANYECLNDYDHSNLFFLLRGKCLAVADVIGCEKGAYVCIKNK